MKEIREEVKTYNIKYKATDGCVFNSKEECEKYENTAKVVLKSKFKKLVLSETSEYNLFDVGSDENLVYVVKMHSAADADTVKQLYLACNDWLLKQDSNKEYINRNFGTIDKAFKEDDILFVGENYDGDIYIINSRISVIEFLNKLDKEKKDE